MSIRVGDIVVRISHGRDIYFRVEHVDDAKKTAILRGLDVRLSADAPISDLEKPETRELAKQRSQSLKIRVEAVSKANKQRHLCRGQNSEKLQSAKDYFEIPGRVLHLDGDAGYMEICRRTYSELKVPAVSISVPEEQQPVQVLALLRLHKPDILVLTGHDGLVKKSNPEELKNYRTSGFFVEAVEKARQFQSGKDDLVIIAGACQSHFQALMKAGANFASAPERVLIHCLDPVLLSEKIAYTPYLKQAEIEEVIGASITGLPGIGGLETRGQFRWGLPKDKK